VDSPPFFVAHCLFDGDSYAFHEFIQLRIHVLGAAWGDEVLGRRIGHSNENDEVYRAMRTEARAAKDSALAAQHQALIEAHGTERNLHLAQADDYARRLGVGRKDVPCIACEAGVGTGSLSILRIDPDWYATDARQRILSECLQRGLGGATIRGLVPRLPVSVHELTQRMDQHLGALRSSIERQMRGQEDVLSTSVDDAWLADEIRRRALVIDRHHQRVYVRGESVSAPPKVYRLLTGLAETAQHKDAVLTREVAENLLWDGQDRSLSALDSVVLRTRSLLKGPVGSRGRGRRTIEIESRRGMGLRLKLNPDEVLLV
jgi:DNA-binding winged helix-turn-helix (wHTH) protein